MRSAILILFIFSFFVLSAKFDSTDYKSKKQFSVNENKLFFHWGYNRAWYSKSDIHFHGDGFDFTLINATGKDRQTPFKWVDYFAIQNLTIPQTNLKIGYFFKNKWALSFGVDHMKYVMQTSIYNEISGVINVGNTNDGVYAYQDKFLDGGFVLFEHTDGLNYINLEVDHYTTIKCWTILKKKLAIESNNGFGFGFLLPKTNTTMFRTKHRDDFNLAGYGFSGKSGIKLSLGEYFYLQSELKGGFINMPNIRISSNKSEGADQHFWFTQLNYLVGFSYQIYKKNETN